MTSSRKSITFRALRRIGVAVGSCIFILVILAAVFFLIPEISIGPERARSLIARFAPRTVQVEFRDLSLVLTRPSDALLSKHIKFTSDDLCVRYQGEAVVGCFDKINIGFTAGWGDDRHESAWPLPHLIDIDPMRIVGGEVRVDVPKFPHSAELSRKPGFDWMGFLRTEVLPRWRLKGSQIDVRSMIFVLDSTTSYRARLKAFTDEKAQALRVQLRDVHSSATPLAAQAALDVHWPTRAGESWKLDGETRINISHLRSLRINASSEIRSWQAADFRVLISARGIAALKEISLLGRLEESRLKGQLSFQVGALGTQLRALDVVGCDWLLRLKEKTGALSCGPETIRLRLVERAALRNPAFFTLQPQMKLEITNLNFGDDKAADIGMTVDLVHFDVLRAGAKITAHLRKARAGAWRYEISGGLSAEIDRFERLVRLMRETPFSIPAPLNVLKGGLHLGSEIGLSESGGAIGFSAATNLFDQTANQAVRVRLDGQTHLIRVDRQLRPSTEASLWIDELRLSAPRFDLRVPPRFSPDPRFGSFAEREREREKPRVPMDLKITVRTTDPHSIRITTNLTRAPIPIALRLVYDGKIDDEKTMRKPALTGWINVDATPIDLFKRNATIEHARLELLESGEERVSANVHVSYLDYDINMLLSGESQNPQIRFVSQPPLDDDQVVAVLLFGRPLNELGDEEKSSVRNLKAALANAALGVSSLYLLARTPIESIGYDADRSVVTAKLGLGGGASVEVGGGAEGSVVGFKKRLSRDFVFRSDVERLGSEGKRTVSALIEWLHRF